MRLRGWSATKIAEFAFVGALIGALIVFTHTLAGAILTSCNGL